MHHAPPLLATIAVGMLFAFAFGFLARRLGLPPLVGYLLAGVAVGPHTPGFVGDMDLASQLAEVGVILLMFGVGLHFSIKDLWDVRRVALPGAVAQIAAATAIGAGVAWLWGWGLAAGLVFGLSLSVASTVVLLRALEGRGQLDSPDGRIAVGWLVVEDLAMVIALVLLPALAGGAGAGGDGHGGGYGNLWLDLAATIGKVGLFAAVMLVAGRKAVPWLLGQVARTGSRELFTLAVLAIAVGIAYGSATLFGVSFALGAFFAGVVLSESDLSHQAAADSLPLQDAFAVLFFISVGMLFDPLVLLREPLPVLATVLIIVVGKSLAAALLVLALGHPLHTALTISASLAQVGEFSFILAGLGVTLGLLPEAGRDLVLAGAILSIILNPAVFALTDRVSRWIAANPDRAPRWVQGRQDALPDEPVPVPGSRSGHAVIVGHGRVGALVARLLADRGRPFVIIDLDRRRCEELRARGLEVVWGDAGAATVLEAAGVGRARLLVMAAPGAAQAQRVITCAKALNPHIDTVVRAQGETDMAWLERCGVGMAAVGERELALAISAYALVRLGVPEAETRDLVQRTRAGLRVGNNLDEIGAPNRAPELRPHREEETEAEG
ncbi:Kef family K(+) transporter [Azospirillum sp. RWY-5-1]|uniref:Kef family K(+) transporter n=1 Tax=Azospirillum oleiclasticum TaxID=2735135 RepID=A0ABX2TJ89_9PROT|nr:YbaL family putative K(+) efflux transporter [Azospirillum oleiclasticum]NYZ17149.1 Kef family K(+) transporter [Azospirillum oleiclasticum]NYZ24286.1 Kef family K(+) transporter [Azospirillum oleiclasticum]